MAYLHAALAPYPDGHSSGGETGRMSASSIFAFAVALLKGCAPFAIIADTDKHPALASLSEVVTQRLPAQCSIRASRGMAPFPPVGRRRVRGTRAVSMVLLPSTSRFVLGWNEDMMVSARTERHGPARLLPHHVSSDAVRAITALVQGIRRCCCMAIGTPAIQARKEMH